ncbi:MAG: helix-turn-helix domain-containing protein, partial [Collinsella sp.]|nr:helix-turn-helix domain-containing protein [Collinsella sp.]
NEIVGMLCVNTDLSTVRSINAMAQQLMACFDAAPRQAEPASIEVEILSESTQELIDHSISELLESRGQDVASLGQADRVDVIRHLNGNGVFMLKGAVACAATSLGISEPSVYRYLQKVRKEG